VIEMPYAGRNTGDKVPSGFREPDASMASFEKLDSQRLFERFDA
jgi:hypothetical protein